MITNPTNNRLHISGSKPFHTLQLYSLDGREMLSQQFAPVQEMELSTATYAPGMYLLVIDGMYKRKMVVGR